MSNMVVSILIAPCISIGSTNSSVNMTDISMCANTVKVEKRMVVSQIDYGKYKGNFFRLRQVVFADSIDRAAK